MNLVTLPEKITHYSAGVAGAFASVVLGAAVAWLVRYVRADRDVRVSMRQALRVRSRWARLAKMAGLCVTDRTPTLRGWWRSTTWAWRRWRRATARCRWAGW